MTISHLFESVELTDVQKQKIDEAYEGAISKRVDEKIAELDQIAEEHKEYLIEQVEEMNKKYLAEQVYPYFEDIARTAVSEFITESQEKFENVTKGYLAESLLSDIKQIFENYDVKTPEGKLSVNKLDEANQKIADLMAETRKKDQQLETAIKFSIVESTIAHLTESDKDRLQERLMAMHFISESQFKSACEKIVESLEQDDVTKITKNLNENTKKTDSGWVF